MNLTPTRRSRASAASTAPSKKSEIEIGCADAVARAARNARDAAGRGDDYELLITGRKPVPLAGQQPRHSRQAP